MATRKYAPFNPKTVKYFRPQQEENAVILYGAIRANDPNLNKTFKMTRELVGVERLRKRRI